MVIGPKLIATCFEGSSKVQGIWRFQSMLSTELGGALEDGTTGGDPLMARIGKEAVKTGKAQRITLLHRSQAAFKP